MQWKSQCFVYNTTQDCGGGFRLFDSLQWNQYCIYLDVSAWYKRHQHVRNSPTRSLWIENVRLKVYVWKFSLWGFGTSQTEKTQIASMSHYKTFVRFVHNWGQKSGWTCVVITSHKCLKRCFSMDSIFLFQLPTLYYHLFIFLTVFCNLNTKTHRIVTQ